MKLKIKSIKKMIQKNNSSQPGLIYQTRNQGHEISITQ